VPNPAPDPPLGIADVTCPFAPVRLAVSTPFYGRGSGGAMRKCPYCRQEYPDDVERCPVDEHTLTGGPPAPLPPEVPAAPEPAPLPAAPVFSDRQMRIIELTMVCVLAFGYSFISSLNTWLYSVAHPAADAVARASTTDELPWVGMVVQELSVLAVVWYVLLRRGKSFVQLGLTWKRSDLGWSVGLYWGGGLAYYLVYMGCHYCGLTGGHLGDAAYSVGKHLFGAQVAVMAVVFGFINPFFEELIARAYVMTEVKALGGSMFLAVVFSALLQASYHLYQGIPSMLGLAAVFFLYSLFYARTGRITPVVLAHLYTDVISTLLYSLHIKFPR